MSQSTNVEAVYSVASLARRWACGPDTVYRLIAIGSLDHFKVGRKRGIRIRGEEVKRWEEQQNMQEATAASGAKVASGLPLSVLAKAGRARG